MRISSSTFTENFLSNIQQLEQQQNTLQTQNQLQEQKVTSSFEMTLRSKLAQSPNLQTDSAANTQYQNNIAQLQDTAATSATAMNSLQTIVSQVNEIATEASSGTTSPTQLATYADPGGILAPTGRATGQHAGRQQRTIFLAARPPAPSRSLPR